MKNLSLAIPVIKSILVFVLISCSCSQRNYKETKDAIPFFPSFCEIKEDKNKMNGVNFVSVREVLDSSHFKPIVNANATWVALVPFGFIRTNSSTVKYNVPHQWLGEKKEGTIAYIKDAKQQGLKILLKPHIWPHTGWVGDLTFTTEADWINFEKTYSNYILDFAKIADSMKVEALCIGVELKQVVKNRPNFWNKLIDTVRSVYNGELTYAANWDNYQNVTFWSKLDFIGIDAYFPISEEQTPSIENCYNGWEDDYTKIKNLSLSTGKQVSFTEYGYRNVDYTGKEPWDDNGNSTFNTDAQTNAYHALYCRFWNESWFKGGFLWKWYPNYSSAGGKKNNRFTPQNKPVEQLIKSVFGKTK